MRRSQTFQYEAIDFIPHPACVANVRQRLLLQRSKRPMLLPFGPFLHPPPQCITLCRRKLAMRVRRRHFFVGVVAVDPADQFARLGLARNSNSYLIPLAEDSCSRIQP